MREPVNGRAAKDPPVGVEQIAVGCVDREQPGQLLDEALEHRLQLEVARQRLRRAQERTLLLDPPPLAVERVRELRRRSRARERERGVAGQRLQEIHLFGAECTPFARRPDHEHRDHPLLRDHREEGGALRTDRVDELPADLCGRGGVEDRERRALENSARDPGRLVLEVEVELAEPLELVPVRAKQTASGSSSIVGDQYERRDVDADEPFHLDEQEPRDGLGIVRRRELARRLGHRLELAVAERRGLDCLPDANATRRDDRALAPPSEDEQGRRQEDEGNGEREPDASRERCPVDGQRRPEGRRHDRQAGEEQDEPPVGSRRPPPLGPERWRQKGGRSKVGRCHNEDRHRVEPQGLSRLCHWAF